MIDKEWKIFWKMTELEIGPQGTSLFWLRLIFIIIMKR